MSGAGACRAGTSRRRRSHPAAHHARRVCAGCFERFGDPRARARCDRTRTRTRVRTPRSPKLRGRSRDAWRRSSRSGAGAAPAGTAWRPRVDRRRRRLPDSRRCSRPPARAVRRRCEHVDALDRATGRDGRHAQRVTARPRRRARDRRRPRGGGRHRRERARARASTAPRTKVRSRRGSVWSASSRPAST